MEQYQKHACSLLLFDLSGFTQLVYQASCSEQMMGQVLMGVRHLFDAAGQEASSCGDVRILTTTGDGFIAMAANPQVALKYAGEVQDHFRERLLSMVNGLPFRQRIDLRVALHHGMVYEVPLSDCHGGTPLFVGDDLNLLARVVNSQTARRHRFALTRAFLELLQGTPITDDPDEVIQDRNQYPEQIEVFRLELSS